MSGIRVFKSIEAAQAAGFVVYDRIPDGYLVRKSTGTTFALAIVKLVTDSDRTGRADEHDAFKEREPANQA